jgi:deoxyribonuclease-4
MQYDKPYYGAHMSIKKGSPSAIKEINELGGNLIQVFVSNPMSTKFTINQTTWNEKNCNLIKSTLELTDSKIVIHLPYVINLAKPLLIPSKMNDCWWINMICNQLLISDLIGSIGCVVHVGKHLELTVSDATDNMFEGLKYVIDFIKKNKLKSYIILETAAGQGSELLTTKNSSLEEFANFYNRFCSEYKPYIKICVDTCHIFAAGYDIRQKSQVKTFFDEFNTLIGIENIALIHLNDSKKECGSCVDRHENLGQGKIGIEGLRHFIRYAIYYHIPTILETPSNYESELELINDVKKGVKRWSENIKNKVNEKK